MQAVTYPQLRIDPLSGLKVILAPRRAQRPFDFKPPVEGSDTSENCPFCEGHESRTPAEITAIRPGDSKPDTPGWSVRVVPNKYPLLADEAALDEATRDKTLGADQPNDHLSVSGSEPDFFSDSIAIGPHEVIIHSPGHLTSLAELTLDQLGLAVEVWRERMRSGPANAYPYLIVNEGASAGASLAHTHAQLLGLPFVPPTVARERERFTAHFERTQGGCLLCDLLQEEVRLQARVVAVDDEAVLIAPYASRLPFQLQIVPRAHQMRFEDEHDGPAPVAMLALALKLLNKKLGEKPALNIWIKTAPRSASHFHWRIEIVPRLTTLAGVELGAGTAVNTYSPEQVAEDLRESASALGE